MERNMGVYRSAMNVADEAIAAAVDAACAKAAVEAFAEILEANGSEERLKLAVSLRELFAQAETVDEETTAIMEEGG